MRPTSRQLARRIEDVLIPWFDEVDKKTGNSMREVQDDLRHVVEHLREKARLTVFWWVIVAINLVLFLANITTN